MCIPAAACRELGDRTQGAEGPLGAAVGQSGRVTAGKRKTNFSAKRQKQKKQEKKKIEQPTKQQVRPDLEEVIERGVAIAAQGIFIFQVLENQRDKSIKVFYTAIQGNPARVLLNKTKEITGVQ